MEPDKRKLDEIEKHHYQKKSLKNDIDQINKLFCGIAAL